MTYFTAEFVEEHCSTCGIHYLLPAAFMAARREGRARGSHARWYCPNGHPQVLMHGELVEVRRERDRLKQENARLEDEITIAGRQRETAERERTKVLKRIGGGTCPCCHRTFSNVAYHMRQNHPEHAPQGQITRTHMVGSWWTKERATQAWHMRADKISLDKIASELGTTKGAVAGFFHRHRDTIQT